MARAGVGVSKPIAIGDLVRIVHTSGGELPSVLASVGREWIVCGRTQYMRESGVVRALRDSHIHPDDMARINASFPRGKR